MVIRRNPEHGRQAVTLLATALVLLLGAAATAFMVLAMTERATWRDWAAWGSLFGGVSLFLWSLHRPKDKGRGWEELTFWLRRQDRSDPLSDYRFRRRPRTGPSPHGNKPPTLESIREAAEAGVHWVPRGPQPERKRPRGS